MQQEELTKEYKILLSETENNILNLNAKKMGLNRSAYIRYLINQNNNNVLNNDTDENNNSSNKTKELKIVLSEIDKELLELKAKKMGLSLSAYVRLIIRTKDFNIITIQNDDLKDYTILLNEIVNTLNGICNYIKKSKTGDIYKQDVERILEISEKLQEDGRSTLQTLYTQRKLIQKKLLTETKRKKIGEET